MSKFALEMRYNKSRHWYWLKRGRETFYDDERYMRIWDTPEEAEKWANEYLGIIPIRVFDPASESEAGSDMEEKQTTDGQLPLF